ncbi:MAG TPA: hypothetical protein VLY04_25935 [Bryobacteraceae bacterium]|nr:hypothetical protein [Bryobacteraceae bacterium]
MQQNNVRRVFFLATLLLSMAAVASAQYDGTCSNATMSGVWGYTITGTLITPTGPVPFGVIGRSINNIDGTSSATQTSSTGGQVSLDTLKGNGGVVNPDCTTTFSVSVYDKSGTLLRTANWSGVLVDNGKELRAIMTSLVLANGTPNGMSIPAIVTMNARKLFPPDMLGWQ